ncbi:helix-turn-helix domain containing protein [Pseudoalteromonas sp. MM17-2]|uniref:helix-turn-helix domain-containing protein n=1 Tax=Pseudoalteromonas sp. MM17-2 TaxID=2917753 RepID=UPI001EF54C40|nr:helix-turn-helix domain-containing protein [Pseudoalteromonas sp. MM17-2]MCG7545567.1 helix-turn-helix domain containing protein [Pseudoalteromonas sp. MM17-2]
MLSDKVTAIDIDAVLERAKSEFGVKSYRQLSEALGMSVSGVSVSRQKGTLPYGALVEGCIKFNISLDKIFFGDSSKQSQTALSQTQQLSKDDLIKANQTVDRVLDKVLPKLTHLSVERVREIEKKLRPLLINELFENEFNEMYVEAVARGAVQVSA